jgi:NAD-dependent deacetylase
VATNDDRGEDPSGAVSRARHLLANSKRIVVLTGAGISTDSGIPDFRGPNGVWTKDPGAERLATFEAYVTDPDVRRRAWINRRDSPAWSARPNAGHRALADLERSGRLALLVTQNIDGLHLDAGHDPAQLVEIHGTVREVVCLDCGDRRVMESVLGRVRAGEEDPRCLETRDEVPCHGILKSATISFGQSLVAKDIARAEAAAEACDLLLAVGTSLGVYPAAALVPRAARFGAAVIIVNGEETPFDDLADVVLRGSISHVLPAIVGLAG